jgi:hypothetical protein
MRLRKMSDDYCALNERESAMYINARDFLELPVSSESLLVDLKGELKGEDVLGNRIIYVSERQKNACLQDESVSCLADAVREAYESIGPAASRIFSSGQSPQPLIGKVVFEGGENLDDYLKGVVSHSQLPKGIQLKKDARLSMYFETPSGTVMRIRKVKEGLSKIKESPISLMDKGFIHSLNKKVKRLVGELGECRSISPEDFHVAYSPDIFKVSGEDIDAYVICKGIPTVIVDARNNDYLIQGSIPLSKKKDVIGKMIKNGFIALNRELGEERIEDLENDILVKYGFECLEKGLDSPDPRRVIRLELGEMEKYTLFLEDKDLLSELDDEWDRMRRLVYQTADLMNLPEQLLVQFIQPVTESHVANELIARLNPTDYAGKLQYDRESFLTEFTKHSDSRKKAIVAKILRNRAHNPSLYDSLKDISGDIYEEVGKVLS